MFSALSVLTAFLVAGRLQPPAAQFHNLQFSQLSLLLISSLFSQFVGRQFLSLNCWSDNFWRRTWHDCLPMSMPTPSFSPYTNGIQGEIECHCKVVASLEITR